jgi:2-phospho-L-lactate guanylyltransferase (CobY/MobA/RfbA family)
VGSKEQRSIAVVLEDDLAMVPAVYQVINRPGILNSRLPRHTKTLPDERELAIVSADTFSTF